MRHELVKVVNENGISTHFCEGSHIVGYEAEDMTKRLSSNELVLTGSEEQEKKPKSGNISPPRNGPEIYSDGTDMKSQSG